MSSRLINEATRGQISVYVVNQPGENLFTLVNATTGEFHVATNPKVDTHLLGEDDHYNELLLKLKTAYKNGLTYIDDEDKSSDSDCSESTRPLLTCFEELSDSESVVNTLISPSEYSEFADETTVDDDLSTPLTFSTNSAVSPPTPDSRTVFIFDELSQPSLVDEQSAPSSPEKILPKKRGRKPGSKLMPKKKQAPVAIRKSTRALSIKF